MEKIYGVATFCAQFALIQKEDIVFRFCLYVCRCVGACGLAPVTMVNEEHKEVFEQ